MIGTLAIILAFQLLLQAVVLDVQNEPGARPPLRRGRPRPTAPKPGASLAFLLAAVGGLGLLVAAYANSFRNAFHFDDSHVAREQPLHSEPRERPALLHGRPDDSALPQNQAYRPLVTLSLAVDYRLAGGLSPVRLPCRPTPSARAPRRRPLRLLPPNVMDEAAPGRSNPYLALFAATLFCVHTANTETMNLMHARSEILSALGIVGGFLVYLGSPRLRRFHLYLLPVAAGALAKTPAVLLAPLLFCLGVPRPGSGCPRERDRSPPGVSALQSLGSRLRRRRGPLLVRRALMAPPTLNYGGGDRLLTRRPRLWVWLHYLRLFVLPIGLSADTDLRFIGEWYDTRVVAGAAIAGLARLAWRSSRGRRESLPVTFGLAWFAWGSCPRRA